MTSFLIDVNFFALRSDRELFVPGKAMVSYVQLSTYFRIGFWYNENKICTVIKLSSPQLVDNFTYGAKAFRCIKSCLSRLSQTNRLCNGFTTIKIFVKLTYTAAVSCSSNVYRLGGVGLGIWWRASWVLFLVVLKDRSKLFYFLFCVKWAPWKCCPQPHKW